MTKRNIKRAVVVLIGAIDVLCGNIAPQLAIRTGWTAPNIVNATLWILMVLILYLCIIEPIFFDET
jgi:hypothetical protein